MRSERFGTAAPWAIAAVGVLVAVALWHSMLSPTTSHTRARGTPSAAVTAKTRAEKAIARIREQDAAVATAARTAAAVRAQDAASALEMAQLPPDMTAPAPAVTPPSVVVVTLPPTPTTAPPSCYWQPYDGAFTCSGASGSTGIYPNPVPNPDTQPLVDVPAWEKTPGQGGTCIACN